MTAAERAIWFAVRDRRLDGFKFKRQVTIGPYIVDFVCLDVGLIVEIDGGQHSAEVDAARSAFLEGQGYTIAQYWNNDVFDNLDGVFQDLRTCLSAPSPACGRGPG